MISIHPKSNNRRINILINCKIKIRYYIDSLSLNLKITKILPYYVEKFQGDKETEVQTQQMQDETEKTAKPKVNH